MNHLSKTQNDPDACTAEKREKPATFEYSAEIQKKIAAMVLCDDRAISQTCKIIRPKYFENPIIQDLVSIMLEYMEKYEKLMPLEALIQEVSGLLDKKPNLPSSMYWDMVEEISVLGLEGDFDYVRDKALDFARYEAVREAIVDSVDLLQKKRDYPEILRRIKEAVDIVPEHDEEELHCIRVADVAEEEEHWLMPNRVPYNQLTIWGGDPGAGKSYLSLWLAAHISAGIPWETDPTVEAEHGSVLILNTEDTIATTVRKRLRLNLAELKKCFVIDSVLKKDKEGERLFSLTKDLNRLGKKIEEIGDVRLLIIDLLDTYLGAGVDSCKSTDISAILAPLKRFAEQNHIAILGLMHLNKKQETSFLYRLLGSVKLIGIPRVVEFITKDRNDPKIRYFHVAKNNCTDEEWETLSFAFHKEKDGRIVIDMETPIPTIEETVGPETKEEAREKRKKTDEAVAILREIFEHDTSPEAVRIAEVQNEHPDIYPNAWTKARKAVGLKHFQRDGVHWWGLKSGGLKKRFISEI